MQEGKPSNTAFAVALGSLCILNSSRHPLWDPRIAAMLEAFLQRAPLLFRVFSAFCKFQFGCKVLNGTMNIFIPGMFSHYVVRKMFIEEQVRKALKSGIVQAVVVGAGFDTLALRLADDFPEVFFLEIDHPATQNVKKNAVEAISQQTGKIPQNFTLAPADLTVEALDKVLKRARYNADLPCVFIVEGVLMYLTENQIAQIFATLKQNSMQKSMCIFTFMEKNSDGRIGFGKSQLQIVNAWLKLKNEPFKWGLMPKEVSSFLRSTGWELSMLSQYENLCTYLKNSHAIDSQPASGEHVALAKWKEI